MATALLHCPMPAIPKVTTTVVHTQVLHDIKGCHKCLKTLFHLVLSMVKKTANEDHGIPK